MLLADFLVRELISGLARFDSSQLFGSWVGGHPSTVRRQTGFKALLHREDHAHPHQEFCYLLSGRCRLSLQHKTVELKAGDMVVCSGGIPHAETICGGSTGYRLVWWILVDKDPWLHVRRYRQQGGYDVEHIIKLTTLPREGVERLNTLRELAAGSVRERPGLETLREAMLSVALELYRQVLKGKETPFDPRADLTRKITDFVRAHSGRPLVLAEVAKAVHMSPNYLTSFYHSQTGVSLGRFILTERIALAQRMLRLPDSSVKSVGLELGFSDPFVFSRAFKRVTGIAPRNWIRFQGIESESDN
jgi:AraC-like DNA-binding protein